MRLLFSLREALRSLGRNAVPGFAAMATVLVTMLILGVFIPIVQATTAAASAVQKKVLLDVYLKDGASPAGIARVRARLERTPHVAGVVYESKQAAYARLRRQDPGTWGLLGANPLPDTFHVKPDTPANVPLIKRTLAPADAAGAERPVDPAINDVRDRRKDTDKIASVTYAIKLAGAILAPLLVLASILLIANTIRLSLFARRRDVEVMKLVGATDWFIRWPFVIEGVLVGALGAALAILLLAVTKIAVLDPLAERFALIAAPRTIDFGILAAILVGAGMAVSAVGSGLSLRRFLRV